MPTPNGRLVYAPHHKEAAFPVSALVPLPSIVQVAPYTPGRECFPCVEFGPVARRLVRELWSALFEKRVDALVSVGGIGAFGDESKAARAAATALVNGG
jgi:hypothetical protein